MNAPARRPEVPAALTLALHVLATFLSTTTDRAKSPLWTVLDGPLPLVGVWFTRSLFFALTADDAPDPRAAVAELVATLGAHGYRVAAGTPTARGRVAEPLTGAATGKTFSVDMEELGVYANSLPAREPLARIGIGALSNRAVSAPELRALAAGPWTRAVDVRRVAARDPMTGIPIMALLFIGEGWRAILRAQDTEKIQEVPPPYMPGAPVVLVCSRCTNTGGHHETEHAAREGALRRRWRRVETNAGDAYLCFPCFSNGAEVPT